MNFESHIETVFAWYCSLARIPGWKDYTWHRIKELAKTDPMYESLPQRLVERMKSEQQKSG